MNVFQAVSLGVCALLVALTAASVLRRRLARGAGAAWILIWLLAGLAIARPQLTVLAARAVGIHRGADLVVYLAILAALIGFFAVFARLRRLDDAITRIVRHLAIEESADDEPDDTRRPGERD
jgi:small membrane protein